MDLKITYHTNSMNEEENAELEETKYLQNISEESTLSEILEAGEVKYDIIGLEKYYPSSCIFMEKCPNVLPYILIDGKYHWNVCTLDATIKDFCETHEVVKKEGLYVTGKLTYELGSDPDFINYIMELWNHYSDHLSGSIVIAGEIISKKALLIRILKMFKPDNLPAPCAVEEIIRSREKWNHYELAEKLDIEPQNAKMLLKGFGYNWLNKEKLYSRSFNEATN